MRDRGELRLYGGRVTDVKQFIKEIQLELYGSERIHLIADKYRQQEFIEIMNNAGITWPCTWRGSGTGHSADGAKDVRAFQNAALGGRIKSKPSLLMESAIASSSVARDKADHPHLEKATSRGRIDVLQAGVLAVSMGERWSAVPNRRVYHGKV